jgi:hypothetical protein
VPELSTQEVRRLRVGAHLLDGRGAEPAAVVRHLTALQAQDRAATLWSMGLRSGTSLAEVEAAVERREVVRTWPMRGTLHWVPAEDARWLCRLLSRPAARAGRRIREQRGLTDSMVEQGREVVDAFLADGPRSRPDVLAAWQAAGIETDQGRGYLLLVTLSEQGHLVQAGLEGRQPTFALLDRWVTGSREPDDEEGLAEVVERYVRSHGPVHEKDVAGWYGGTLRDVRAAVASLGERITTVDHDGTTLLVHAEAEPPAGPVVALLPAFDELLLGHKDRSLVLDPDHLSLVVPGGNGVFLGSVLVDGRVVGTWRHKERRDRVEVAVTPFEPLDRRTVAAVEEAAAAYASFVGRELDFLSA